MDRRRSPVVIDAATGHVETTRPVKIVRKRTRHDPVKARDFAAELEAEVKRFFDAQRQRAFGIAEDFTRELAGTLRRAMRGRG